MPSLALISLRAAAISSAWALLSIWQGPAKTIDQSGNPYVDQFIHGRAEGPIQMDVLKP